MHSVKMPSPLRKSTFKQYRNKLHHIIKSAEKSYFQNKIELYKNNLHKSWGVIKEIIGKQKTKPMICKKH